LLRYVLCKKLRIVSGPFISSVKGPVFSGVASVVIEGGPAPVTGPGGARGVQSPFRVRGGQGMRGAGGPDYQSLLNE
jgi:hypothetical protein